MKFSIKHFVEEAILDKSKDIIERRFLCISNRYSMQIMRNAGHYFLLEIGNSEREIFCAAFLDNKLGLIACEKMFYGTINECSVYNRELVKRALYYNATSVIIAHNHPSGDATPSREDEILTRRLRNALALVNIKLTDHLIVAGANVFSFCKEGFL